MKEKPKAIVDGVDIITPLKLRGQRGPWRIETDTIRRGEKVVVVNMRNAIYSGLKPRSVIIQDFDLTVHKLLHKGALVTSDCPNEIYTQWKNGFGNVHGDVLVGGLGIGMASVIVANAIEGVESVTTVELEREVIRLVKPQLPETLVPHRIVRADLFKYIKTSAEKGESFDSAYFDIWSPTGESAWHGYIVPLRRLMAKYQPGTDVYNWLEGDMLGQVRISLMMAVTGKQISIFGHQYDVPEADLEKLGISRGSQAMWVRCFRVYDVFMKVVGDTRDQKAIQELMDLYTTRVGSPDWERTFGKLWDTWKKPTRKEEKAILAREQQK